MNAHFKNISRAIIFTRSLTNAQIFFFCLLFLFSTTGKAQNLVPNPSFELRDSCPSGYHIGFPFPSEGSMFASNWFRPSVGTSDYYNACAPLVSPNNGLPVSVPAHGINYQMARTGQAYAGGILDKFHCEYVESPLLSPLVAGHRYFVSYWLNTQDHSWGGADRYGAHFSVAPVEMPNTLYLDMLTPQVESPAGVVLYDTLNWMKVSGVFAAAGGESWVTIGNFHSLATLDTILVTEPMGFGAGPFYYYYEDVCVVDMDGTPSNATRQELSICPGQLLDLTARSGMERYLWNNDSLGTKRTVTQPGTYWVKSVDLNACAVFTDSFIVAASGAQLHPKLGADRAICPGESITLNAAMPGGYRYLWNTGATDSAITITSPGEYYVSVSSGCAIGSDTVNVISANNCDKTNNPGGASGQTCIFIPSAFSPNGDGLNDKLTVKSLCGIENFQLNIYNRFGEVVFHSYNPQSGWDGTFGGHQCDVGTYYYLLYYTNNGNSGQQLRKGDVTLIR
jgi:gliding motility-associated-like protein